MAERRPMGVRLEHAWLWVAIALGAAAGAVVFGVRRDWLGFTLFSVATLLALLQLLRIFGRTRTGGTKRRY